MIKKYCSPFFLSIFISLSGMQQNNDLDISLALPTHNGIPISIATLFLFFAVHADCANLASQMLAEGAQVNAYSNEGHTPLHVALLLRRRDMVAFLLKAGADPHATNLKNEAPWIYIASRYGDYDAVLDLLRAGVDPNCRTSLISSMPGRTPIYYAALGGHGNVIELLIKRGALVTIPDSRGFYPFHAALRHNHVKEALQLFNEGMNPNLTMFHQRTLLHFAVSKGCLQLVSALLDAGANPNKLKSIHNFYHIDGRNVILRRYIRAGFSGFKENPSHDIFLTGKINWAYRRMPLSRGVLNNACIGDSDETTPYEQADIQEAFVIAYSHALYNLIEILTGMVEPSRLPALYREILTYAVAQGNIQVFTRLLPLYEGSSDEYGCLLRLAIMNRDDEMAECIIRSARASYGVVLGFLRNPEKLVGSLSEDILGKMYFRAMLVRFMLMNLIEQKLFTNNSYFSGIPQDVLGIIQFNLLSDFMNTQKLIYPLMEKMAFD